jgi:prepilin-type processing-associated H-X9-DG protein
VLGWSPVKETEVVAPSDMIAIGDSIPGGVEFMRDNIDYLLRHNVTERHAGQINVLFCDGHIESPTLDALFVDTSDAALVRWNRDHQPHRDRL